MNISFQLGEWNGKGYVLNDRVLGLSGGSQEVCDNTERVLTRNQILRKNGLKLGKQGQKYINEWIWTNNS